MAFFSKNVDLGAPKRISSWRKIAIGTWPTIGDPSVYAAKEFRMEAALDYIDRLEKKTNKKITLGHFMGKALAETIRRHPAVNCVLRWGRLYPRKDVSIFFQVATDLEGKDLSGLTVRNADQKSISEIASQMQAQVEKIRALKDPSYAKMKGVFAFVPGVLARWILSISGFILYTLNIYVPAMGAPRDSFGSAMLTNIGTLGLDDAYAPLVPYARVPLLVAVGMVREKPVVENNQIKIGKVLKINVTVDHRVIDGMHASQMAKTLQSIIENPDQEIGPIG